ncbi:hypothetical protein PMZ80_008465 [Knufia obscura]|uniref:Uncharacterized protein n=1 Tax=Knufia obscura TaxID=1635080 RepID=A0ABR0REW3_9EURO|nr:hypothetical protein PMZ80_008465 [Knufia obscura]
MPQKTPVAPREASQVDALQYGRNHQNASFGSTPVPSKAAFVKPTATPRKERTQGLRLRHTYRYMGFSNSFIFEDLLSLDID